MATTAVGKETRYRLLAQVRAEAFTPHVRRRGEVLSVHPGDEEWFKENIGCRWACPVLTDVPRYLALIAEGQLEEAYRVNREANLFPEIVGRVCHRPCETACRRGLIDEPVAICHLKRFAADRVRRRGLRSAPTLSPKPDKGKIAVVGSGPAGLAAAWELVRRGHRVALYEAEEAPGGLLTWGIPPYRLPKALVEEAISELKAMGVEIITTLRVGEKLSLEELFEQFDAVLVAVGAPRPLKLGIPGEEAQGVIDGLRFMREVNGGRGEALGVRGKRVAVIGGGFTAIDCARSAVRLGAKEVTILYRRTRAEMPAFGEEVAQAEEEGVRLKELVSPLEIRLEGGRVRGLRCIRNRLGEPDESGRPRPVPIEGSEFEFEADLAITALGQARDSSLLEGLEIAIEGLEVDEDTLMVESRPGLFLAGDFLKGPSTVIEAIATGRRAAWGIDRYLEDRSKAQTPKGPRAKWVPLSSRDGVPAWTKAALERRLAQAPAEDEKIPRRPMPTLPISERTLTREVELGYSEEEAQAEAGRCYQCQLNLFVESQECILCNKCVEACPHECLSIVSFDRIRGELPGLEEAKDWLDGGALVLDETRCTRCGKCIKSCPPQCMRMEYFLWEEAYGN